METRRCQVPSLVFEEGRWKSHLNSLPIKQYPHANVGTSAAMGIAGGGRGAPQLGLIRPAIG
jgi:hypothetical protein